MNVFQFKHVGKGLFYTGSISDAINFVYDCGTAGSTMILRNEIAVMNYLNRDDAIDFAVVSHIDGNYINGFPHLCKTFKVKKIYLPYLGNDKQFIRFLIFAAIFKTPCKSQAELEERTETYIFFCKLYGVDIFIKNNFGLVLPCKTQFLGADDADDSDAKSNFNTGNSAIRIYKKCEENALWTFLFMNKCVNRQCFEKFSENLRREYEDLEPSHFEAQLFAQTRTQEGIYKIADTLKKILGDIKPRGLSCNLLIHYPKKPMCKMYVCEYKTVNRSYLQSPERQADGSISVLLGDIDVDRILEEQLYSCGNFSLCGGMLQIPDSSIKDDRLETVSLTRTFKTFVLAADNGKTIRTENSVVPNLITYPNKQIKIATQSTGVTYYVE